MANILLISLSVIECNGNVAEESQNRMQLDTSDRMIIMAELMKHTHPLMTAHDSPLINIVLGGVAEYGDMRKGKKSTIHRRAVFSESLSEPVDLELIGANESLCHCQWPKKATIKVFVTNFLTMFNMPYE